MDKERAIIVDLDGTLCNIEHRKSFFLAGDFNAFEAKMADDKPNWSVAAFIGYHLSFGYQPFFITGRKEKHRGVTNRWIEKHMSEFSDIPILMRDDDDDRPDATVKRQLYREQIEPTYEVRLVLEDRSHVVDMWRDLGLECWQVADGDY